MSRNVKEIIEQLPVAQREIVEKRAAELISEEMTLRELRRARKLTQAAVARKLGISQDGVSRIEQRTDLLISTLRKTLKPMNGKLSLIVEFPDRPAVTLSGIGEEKQTRKPRRDGSNERSAVSHRAHSKRTASAR